MGTEKNTPVFGAFILIILQSIAMLKIDPYILLEPL